MKDKPWKREVKYLYLRLMKHGNLKSVDKVIGWYEMYNNFSKNARSDADCPEVIRGLLIPDIRMPKYLEWAKEYLIK